MRGRRQRALFAQFLSVVQHALNMLRDDNLNGGEEKSSRELDALEVFKLVPEKDLCKLFGRLSK